MLAVAATAGATSACASLKQEDLDAGLESLRAELSQQIQDGDQANARATQQLSSRVDGIESRLQQFNRDMQSMEQEYGGRIERLQTSMRFNLPVYFGFDKADLTAEAMPILDRFQSVANEYYPTALITVEGMTDPAGDPEYNIALGMRRAETVKGYLVDHGMSADRIRTVSYGEAGNRLNAEGAQGPGTMGWENRRAVLVIDHDGQPPAEVTMEETLGAASELLTPVVGQ